MKKYNNLTEKSGIVYYELGKDYIKIKFNTIAKPYVYSYKKAGKSHVENMKNLALKGIGLNTYINKYVRNLYD